MSLGHSPQVVTNGMVLCLDAANPKNFNLTEVEVLVVAGGGGGGVCYGGGGGGGGIIYNRNFAVTPGSALTVTVGNGGTNQVNTSGNGGNGGNSVFGSLTAIGGGYGGGNCGNVGGNGGSGGGGSGTGGSSTSGGTGTSQQGTSGGTSPIDGGGGGGGAGSSGSIRQGGNGLGFNISGTFTYYGGGGSGGGFSSLSGGIGGGGLGGIALASGVANATANTGGGGGGSIISGGVGSSGLGGSGIVIVRYPGPQKAIGGTVTSIGGYTIHTFTTVGSTTFTPLVATNNSAISGLSDLSGNGNFGTSGSGSAAPTYSSANGGSVSFDGTDDYVNGNLGGALNAPFTLEVFGKFNNVSQTNYEYFGSIGGFSANGMISISKIGTQDPNSSYHGFMYVYPGSGDAIKTNIDLRTTNYQHLVVVLLSSSPYIKVYKNGVEGSMVDALSAPINTNGNYRIGTWGNNTWWLNGNIGSFKVYNRALTAAEISQNFNALRGRYGI